MEVLENYMLPCLNKTLFGIECMGCGIQRSVILILKCHFIDAFYMYPAIYSLIILISFSILNSFKNYQSGSKIIITLAVINLVLIITNFVLKFL